MDCSITGFPVLHHLPELAQTHVHWVGDAIQPSHPVVPFSSYHQSVPISGSFQMSQLHIRWPKYWRFSFSISSPNEYSGLISFWIDWFDLLAVQETLKSFLQHYNSKAINSSALSCLYDPTFTSIHDYWKHHSFDYIWTFIGKVISLLLNMLSRFILAFLPRSKCHLISWLQSPSTVILEPKKIKSSSFPRSSLETSHIHKPLHCALTFQK